MEEKSFSKLDSPTTLIAFPLAIWSNLHLRSDHAFVLYLFHQKFPLVVTCLWDSVAQNLSNFLCPKTANCCHFYLWFWQCKTLKFRVPKYCNLLSLVFMILAMQNLGNFALPRKWMSVPWRRVHAVSRIVLSVDAKDGLIQYLIVCQQVNFDPITQRRGQNNWCSVMSVERKGKTCLIGNWLPHGLSFFGKHIGPCLKYFVTIWSWKHYMRLLHIETFNYVCNINGQQSSVGFVK